MHGPLRTLGLTSLALALAACGGQKPGSSTPAATPNALTRQEASHLKQVAPLMAGGLLSALRPGGALLGAPPVFSMQGVPSVPLSAQGVRAQNATGNCGPTELGADADGDGIPANLNYTYDCTDDEGAYQVRITGSVQVKDANDNDPNSGFTSRAQNLKTEYVFRDPQKGTSTSVSVTNNWTVTATVAGNTTSLAYDSRFDILNGFVASNNTATFALNFNATFVSDDDGTPDRYDSGTLNLSGRFSATGNGKTYALNLSATDLHFSAACAFGPDRGQFKLDDGTNNLSVNYAACNQYAFTYNGQSF